MVRLYPDTTRDGCILFKAWKTNETLDLLIFVPNDPVIPEILLLGICNDAAFAYTEEEQKIITRVNSDFVVAT